MRRNARFLLELAKGRRPRLLGLVDPALRHLPGFVGIIDPCADEHLALAVEEHHADSATIAIVLFCHSLAQSTHRSSFLIRSTRISACASNSARLVRKAETAERCWPNCRFRLGSRRRSAAVEAAST